MSWLILLALLLAMPGVHAERTPLLLWRYDTGQAVNGVAVTENGTVVAAAYENVTLFEAGGRQVGNNNLRDFIAALASTPGGEYTAVGTGEGKVYLFDSNLTVLWKYLVMLSPSAVAISRDGDAIAVAMSTPTIYLLDRKGEVAWRYKAEKVPTSIALSSKGDLIAVATKEAVYLLDRFGSDTWLYKTGGPARGVAMDGRGRVAVGINASLLLLEGGKEVWRYDVGGPVRAVAMTGGGEFVLLSTEDKLYLLGGSGKPVWDGDIGGILSLAISPNGSYVALGTDDHFVYLVRNAEPAVAGAPESPGAALNVTLNETIFKGGRIGEEAEGLYVLGRLVPQETVHRALVVAAVAILIFLFFPRRRKDEG
ncbi:MAG: WD40 repeat domain-containing protein [Euryarchaeota archaeon]|nr:WD40 repeat domain-containing protein [Euryarchaeota archaeon]